MTDMANAEDMARLGGRIKSARKRKQLNQKELAELINISPSYLSQLEHGSRLPSAPMLAKLSSALEIELKLPSADRGRAAVQDERVSMFGPILWALGIDLQQLTFTLGDDIDRLAPLEALFADLLHELGTDYQSFLKGLLRVVLAARPKPLKALEERAELWRTALHLDGMSPGQQLESMSDWLYEQHRLKTKPGMPSRQDGNCEATRPWVALDGDTLTLRRNLPSEAEAVFALATEIVHRKNHAATRSPTYPPTLTGRSFQRMRNDYLARYGACCLTMPRSKYLAHLRRILASSSEAEALGHVQAAMNEPESISGLYLLERFAQILLYDYDCIAAVAVLSEQKVRIGASGEEIRYAIKHHLFPQNSGLKGLHNSEHYCRLWQGLQMLTESRGALQPLTQAKGSYNQNSEEKRIKEGDIRIRRSISIATETTSPSAITISCLLKDQGVRESISLDIPLISPKLLKDLNKRLLKNLVHEDIGTTCERCTSYDTCDARVKDVIRRDDQVKMPARRP